MPKLSIIIPTFNSEGAIQRCLQSIHVQTFTDYEIVIQDGGSSDQTVELIQNFQYENPGVRIELMQEPDEGPYDAMNKGVRRASGDWLYFLGSDDELYDSNVLGAMLGNSYADSHSLLYGNVMMIPIGSSIEGGFIYDGLFDVKKLLNRNICHQAIFYKRSLAVEVGEYETRYPLYGDWDFNLRCWPKVPFQFVNLVVARFYLGGISNNGRRDERFEVEMATRVMQEFNLKLYSPLLNTPNFYGAREVVRMQRAKGVIFASFCRALRVLKRQNDRIRRVWSKVWNA